MAKSFGLRRLTVFAKALASGTAALRQNINLGIRQSFCACSVYCRILYRRIKIRQCRIEQSWTIHTAVLILVHRRRCSFIPALRLHRFMLNKAFSEFGTGSPTTWGGRHCSDGNASSREQMH